MTQTGRPPCQTGNKPTPTGENIIHHFENAVKMEGVEVDRGNWESLKSAVSDRRFDFSMHHLSPSEGIYQKHSSVSTF